MPDIDFATHQFTEGRNDKKARIILAIYFIMIPILVIFFLVGLISLNSTRDIDPVIIIGSLLLIGCILYSIPFFIWNTVICYQVFIRKTAQSYYFMNAILILILSVIIPYSLSGLMLFIGWRY